MSFLFRRKTANTRTRWDHTFEETPDHMSVEEMEPLKFSYDKLADEALERLEEISPPHLVGSLPRNPVREHPSVAAVSATSQFRPASGSDDSGLSPSAAPVPTPKRDLVALLREHHASDPVLSRLWEEANTVPPWVDWEQVARGQDVFYRYGGASINGLAFQSLVGGMGAARVVEVLARTGGFSTRTARHRLYETTQYVLQCTRDVDSIRPGAGHEGWEASLRVRLLHAAVRRRILRLEALRPGYYSVSRYGIPINDLDCIGTIASFSASLIWLSFPRQGILLRAAEIDDYVALWRYLAHLVGAPTQPFASPARAKAAMESLLLHEVEPSAMSATLGHNVIEALASLPPTYASRDFLAATCRWLLGGALCDALRIRRPPLYYSALVAGQCLFFMALNYTYRSVARWDRAKIAFSRRALWRFIVDSDHGLAGRRSDFDFKHLPELGKTTVRESAAGGGLAVPHGVERRNLLVFSLFGGVLALSAAAGLKLLVSGVRIVSTR